MKDQNVYLNGKLLITAAEAARGYQLLDKIKDFALIQPVNENIILATPLRRDLRALEIKFEAIDFLTFREGRNPVESPWKYLMCINGLHRISITFNPKNISFEKMPEWNWQEILPELKSILSNRKNLLLKSSGALKTQIKLCG